MAPQKPEPRNADDQADDGEAARAPRTTFRMVLFGVGLLGTALIAGGTYWFLKPEEERPAPAVVLAAAFRELEEGNTIRAQNLAMELQKKHYRHYLEFSGDPEYILGMAAYRDAINPSNDEVGREQKYLEARTWLHKADDDFLIDPHKRAEWEYVYGKSLYYTGASESADEHLEKAIADGCEEKIDASFMLIDIHLHSRNETELKKALGVSRELLKLPGLTQDGRDRAYLQQAQLFLSLGLHQEAEAVLKKLPEASNGNQAKTLFGAQALMAHGRYAEAIDQLRSIVQDITANVDFSRQASYLLGVCRENLGDDNNTIINAIDDHERTADRFGGTPEGLAATARAASLSRKIKSNEKALAAYLDVLKSITPGEDYQNRWLSEQELQSEVILAWEDWVANQAFSEAIALAQAMSSILDEVKAIEYTTLAHQKWAEHLQARYDDSTPQEREALAPELRDHWRLSGRQYDILAEAWKTTPRYTEAVRLSAEHFRLGHEHERSLEQWKKFIDAEPALGMPNAYVQMGEVLMDLDRLDDAMGNFSLVIERFPTDAARFSAEYLSGQCNLEKNELDKAEQIWRSIIVGGDLGPGAREWRLSLFSLGKLLSNKSDLLRWKATDGTSETLDKESQKLLDESYARAEEAIRRLEEYVKRYPQSNEATQARFLLAHSLQYVADQHRRKFAVAETENARQEQLKAMREQLSKAAEEYTFLRDEKGQLLDREKQNMIEPLEKFMLKECYFEIAHTRYGLEQYAEAVTEYTKAANRYPHDARAVLAYLQMTRCYDKLGKPTEARSKLEQVKYILEGLSQESFQPHLTNLSKEEWQGWVEWAIRLYQHDQTESNRPLPTNEPAS